MSRSACGKVLLVGVLLGTTVAAFQQAPPPRDAATLAAAGTAIIRGRVIELGTGNPVRRVQVVARAGEAANQSHTVMTDDSGRFELTKLAAGRYQLSAAKGGFVTLQHGQRRPLEPGRPLVLANGQTLTDVNFTLPRGSVITGRVVDPFGDAVTGASVQVHAYRYVNGRRQLTMVASAAPTDDRGQFRVFGLLPGDYYVSAGPPGELLSAISSLASSGGIGNILSATQATSGYTRTYYPGTPSPTSAQPVRVGVGEEAPPLTIELYAASLATVSGVVMTPGGTPANASVFLRPKGSDATQLLGNSMVGMAMNGAFKISNVVPGDYTIEAMIVDPLAKPMRMTHGMTDVVVAGDVSDVVINAGPGITVRGRITFGNGETPGTLQRSQVRLTATADNPSLAGGGQATVRDDWTFEISGLTGARTVRANPPAPWTLSRVMRGSADITDAAVEFLESDDLTIVLTQRATEVTGVVTDSRGAATSDWVVLWFADDRARWTPQTRFIRTARPEPDGRYRIRGLPPAAYLVIAVQYLEPGEELDPDRLEQFRRGALRVELRDAESRSVDLRLADL
jgi:protocatechuate 3,4-dioxygenase beta subunit